MNTEIQPLTEIEAQEMGKKLTEYYWRVNAAWGEILAFGSLLTRVEAHLSANVQTNQRERGRYVKDTGVRGFLKTYAPEVDETKAYRWRDVARVIAAKIKIAEPWRVFNTPMQELPPADRKKREEALAFTEEKSMRAIQLELGLFEKKQAAVIKKYDPPATKPSHELCIEVLELLHNAKTHACRLAMWNQLDRTQHDDIKYAFEAAADEVAKLHAQTWGRNARR